MAAGVQHDDRAGLGGVQRRQQAVEVDAAPGRVVIGVGADLEASLREDAAVVFPTGIADQDLGLRVQLLQEVGAYAQAAGAAQGLDRGHAAALDRVGLGPEDQALDRGVIGRDAIDRQVAAGRVGGHHLLFRLLHALQQRQLAVVVVVHADAEVHFLRVRIGDELLGQAQDRVAGRHFDGVEERHGVPWMRWQRRPACCTLAGCPQF